MFSFIPALAAVLAPLFIGVAVAEPVPAAVKAFRDSIVAKGKCAKPLENKFFTANWGASKSEFAYCGDNLATKNVIYLQGPKGALADMDIDCDGSPDNGGDKRCEVDGTQQFVTSFADTVKGYGVAGVNDLNAFKHSYVVFGNIGKRFAEFNPRSYGIKPLSIMAVVCGDKLFYGVWGDENGNDGDAPMVGEASIGLATACFGTSMNGNNGHDQNDVLYLAFPGTEAETVPGAKRAAWGAKNFNDFHASIKAMGDNLIKRVTDGSGGGEECSWPGHCLGADCTTFDDCSDELICTNGKCAKP